MREWVFQRLVCLPRRVRVLTIHIVFISEITARAFIIADSNKRRTLSRSDIAKALSKSDQFDFLIDVVPREDGGGGHAAAATVNKGKKKTDEVRFSPLGARWPRPPFTFLVQPQSPSDTPGEQLEEDDQVAQTLSLGHVRTSCSLSKWLVFAHHPHPDKFHARLRARI